MKIEKITYSYNAIQECIDKIKELSISVDKKSQHGWRIFQVKEVYDFCYEKTSCWLFQADYSPWKNYLDTWTRKGTKKELDACLRRAVRFLQNEISDIKTSMILGEVNSVE